MKKKVVNVFNNQKTTTLLNILIRIISSNELYIFISFENNI